jgi:phospholipase B1
MSVGDSISAGFAMYAPHATDFNNFSSMLIEYRGDVFSIGGNDGYYTLPNFIKKYNPDLQGASIGNSLPLDYVKWKNHVIQPFDSKVTHLNGAQSGARVEDVPAQIDYLTQQLQTTYNKTVDFKNDWKILTILIGANNLCGACTSSSYSQPDFYQQQLELVLQKTYTQIPRVFVNILLMFNISQVYTCMMTSVYCITAVNFFTTTECGCLTDHTTPQQRQEMDIFGVAYNQKIYELEETWAAKNLTDFAVRVQPFTQNCIFEKIFLAFYLSLSLYTLSFFV